MKKTKAAGWVILIGSIALFCVALFADYLGLGDVDPDHFTFGTKQITGLVLGTIGAVAGIFLWSRK